MADRAYLTYEITAPKMDKKRPSTKVKGQWFPELVGVDGRFSGSLHKFYGFKLVRDFGLTGVNWCECVSLSKGNSDKINGFLIRHGSDSSSQSLTFYYYDTGSDSWSSLLISLDVTLTSTTNIDCDSSEDYLYIAVAENTIQVVYWDSSSEDLVQHDVGAGEFYDGGTSLDAPSISSVDNTGHLSASGTYNIAYRYYDSTRKIYSAMSEDLTVTPEDEDDTLSGNEAEVAVSIPTPSSSAQEMFDTIQVYRTINQSSLGSSGGILFLETSIDITSSTASVGTILDTALTTQEKYDSRMDVVVSTPKGGAVKLFKGCLFTGGDPAINGGADIIFSSPYHESYEYFAEDAKHIGDNMDGSIIGFFEAGETLYAATKNSLIMIRKEGGNIKFQRLHVGRGVVNSKAAHTVGSSILAVTPLGVGSVDSQQSMMQMLSSLDRKIAIEWINNLDNIQSAIDGQYGCSFFLEPDSGEVLCVWHTSSSATELHKTGFTTCASGVEPTTGSFRQAFLLNDKGRVVTPDRKSSGSGSMWDISGTLQGSTTSKSTTNKIHDSEASFSNDLLGASVYFPESRSWDEIVTVNSSTELTLSNTATIETGTKYVLNGILFAARCWNVPLTNKEGTLKLPFTRRNITSMSLDIKNIEGFDSIDNNFFTVGAFRNGGNELYDSDTITVDENPSDSVADVHVDGVAVEPYIEQMSVGTKFDLTMLDVGITIVSSRKVTFNG